MSRSTGHPRTLVTGGAGFIGSHLCERLVSLGRRITVVDDLSTGRRSNIQDLLNLGPDAMEFVEGEVEEIIPQLDPRRFNEVYHLAAAVGVRLVIEQPVHTIRTNVIDTMTVLDFAADANIPTLIASTSEVYGKSAKPVFSEDDDVVYGPTIYSRWSYACSKAIDEYLALAYHRQRNLSVVIARFFNTVGPRQVGRYGMVIPRFVEAALANRPLDVHGDGRQSRCFCDVRDVVEVLPRMLEAPKCRGRVFNIGHDEPIEIGELAKLVRRTLDSSSEIRLVPYAEALGEGFDDLRHRRPDLTRLRQAVGFTPTIPLDQTIRDLCREMTSGGRALESAAP